MSLGPSGWCLSNFFFCYHFLDLEVESSKVTFEWEYPSSIDFADIISFFKISVTGSTFYVVFKLFRKLGCYTNNLDLTFEKIINFSKVWLFSPRNQDLIRILFAPLVKLKTISPLVCTHNYVKFRRFSTELIGKVGCPSNNCFLCWLVWCIIWSSYRNLFSRFVTGLWTEDLYKGFTIKLWPLAWKITQICESLVLSLILFQNYMHWRLPCINKIL